MAKCPKCLKGELVCRETEGSVLIECSRRGKTIPDRRCDYVETYSKEDAEELEEKERLWVEAVTGA